jgi:tRNA(Ser,Leu) C12 N-acetylase TAN1
MIFAWHGTDSSTFRELQVLLHKVLSDQEIVDKIVNQESFKRIVEGQVSIEDWAHGQYNLLKDRARRILELPDEPEPIPIAVGIQRRGSVHRYANSEEPVEFRSKLFVDDPRLSFMLHMDEVC